MNHKFLIRVTALFVFLGLAALATPAQDQGSDDVAAAARKAREQQKNAPAPKKVVTNDDFRPAPSNPPAAATTPENKTEAQADEQKKDQSEENDPKSEAYWRRGFQKLRDKLSAAEQELSVLQRELEKSQVQYYPDPQKALMQQHDRSDINDKAAKIDAKKKEIDSLKQQLSDLEDELRKSGGDPGWAR